MMLELTWLPEEKIWVSSFMGASARSVPLKSKKFRKYLEKLQAFSYFTQPVWKACAIDRNQIQLSSYNDQ